jgi:enoyl-CoA hydratase/carnithine racemase
MPGRSGLFLALTGAPVNAADARFAGLADFVLEHDDKSRVLDAFGQTCWSDDAATNHRCLSKLLDECGSGVRWPESMLRRHYDRIDAVIGYDGLVPAAVRLDAMCKDPEPWLAAAAATFSRGAPSSAALSFALWQRALHLSLAEVFRLEYQVSVAATMLPDFSEGVRALLVDKDRNPHWQHTCIADVDGDEIAALLHPRFDGTHPLSDLG